jgi:uncharacterized membrane protein
MNRPQAAGQGRGGIELERVMLFSDAVFAIAITLLVLELKIPDRETVRTAAELAAALGADVPRFAAFFISFAVIGLFWISHHRMFRYIRRWNEPLLGLNLLFLLFVAFLPYPVALFGSFRRQPAAIAFYAAAILLTGLSQNLLWWYAARGRRLVAPDLDARIVRYVQFRAAAPPLIFAVSVPFAFAHVTWTMITWLVAIPLLRVFGGRFARAAREAERLPAADAREALPAAAPTAGPAPPAAGPGPARA